MEAKQPDIAPRKAEAKGPSTGIYIGAAILLLAGWIGARNLMMRKEKPPEEPSADQPVVKPAPLAMPAPRPLGTATP